MIKVRLGESGLQASRLALGTMLFGSQLDEQRSFALLDRAAELGIDFLDLADIYPSPPSDEWFGRSEEIVGRWLRTRSESFVVATKCGLTPRGGTDVINGRKYVVEACEASLRRLGVERIDLFYLHRWDPNAPLDEALAALDQLVRDGKVHYLAVSNFEAWQLALVLQRIAEAGLTKLTVVQPRYNLLSRADERDLLPLCQAAGIAVVPYNPLGAGVLTGKYQRGQELPQDWRFGASVYGERYRGRYWSDQAFDVLEEVTRIATEHGVSPARVAMAWLLAQPGVSSPIVGASSPKQLDDNVAALELELTPEQLERLDAVSLAFR